MGRGESVCYLRVGGKRSRLVIQCGISNMCMDVGRMRVHVKRISGSTNGGGRGRMCVCKYEKHSRLAPQRVCMKNVYGCVKLTWLLRQEGVEACVCM